jgi:hypothetical protein
MTTINKVAEINKAYLAAMLWMIIVGAIVTTIIVAMTIRG